MKDLIIDSAEVFVVGPETKRYAWAIDMPEQYMTNTILRLRTKGGLEGIAGGPSYTDYHFDRAVAEVSEAARRLLTSLHTHAPARDREAEAEKAKERSRLRFG